MTSQGCVMFVTKAIRFSFSKRKRTMALGHELFTIQRVVQYHIYPLLWLASTTPSFYLQFPNFRWHWIRFSTWTSLMSIPFSFTGFTDTVVLVVCVTFHRFKKWCHEILYWNSRARGLPLLCIMFWESFRESCLEGLIFSFCFTV